MNTDLLAPFANATCETLKLLLDVDARTGTAGATDGCAEDKARISVAIGITGDVSGEALYRFPVDTTLEIVKTMSGMEFTEIDEFVTSALGEIANIISGNAVTDLSGRQITCDILPPKILDGEELPSAADCTYVYSAKIDSSIGDVEVVLRVKTD